MDITWLASQFPNLSRLEPLSSGGQKTVAACLHHLYGPVVLKIIRPDQEVVETEREILAVQRVASPRVPEIFEYGEFKTPMGSCLWLLERRILGQTLRALITANPLAVNHVKQLAVQMLEALASAEAVHIVHRDVKPDNIICDGNQNFWLIDFGIARHLTLASITATSDLFGKSTIGYAPREQMRNLKLDIDARSDLFALGVTLYEALTGSNPYYDPPPTTPLEVISRVENWALPRLEDSIAGREFSELIAALTQRRRDHRPTSAAEALEWALEVTS